MSMTFTIGGNGRDVTGAMTAAEAIERAGLDWTTHTERIKTESGQVITGRRCKAVVRDDTGDVLGIVGKKHGIIDNRTCFDFMDCVSGSAGGVTYETAGYRQGLPRQGHPRSGVRGRRIPQMAHHARHARNPGRRRQGTGRLPRDPRDGVGRTQRGHRIRGSPLVGPRQGPIRGREVRRAVRSDFVRRQGTDQVSRPGFGLRVREQLTHLR
jgi:hypothetical protein